MLIRMAFTLVLGIEVATWGGGTFNDEEERGLNATITIHHDWQGLDQNTADSANDLPPDPVIAASEHYVVTVVNRTIKIYDDEGSAVAGEETDLDDFFDEASESFFDPKVVYDHYEDRFVLSCIRDEGNMLYVAWSEPATDPSFPELSEWGHLSTAGTGFSFSCGGESLAGAIDHTSLGFDDTAWYVSCLLAQAPANQNTANIFYLIPKPNGAQVIDYVLSSDFPPGGVCLSNANPPFGTEGARAAQHAQQPRHEVVENEGDVPTPYFASVVRQNIDDDCDEGLHNTIRIYSIGDPLEASHTRTLHSFDLKTQECFNAFERYFAPTSDTATSGEDWAVGDARITNAHYRQDGSDEFLYIAHTVNDPVDVGAGLEDRYAVRWYKIDLNGWPGLGASDPVIDTWGQIEAPALNVPVHTFLPTVFVNDDQEMAIVYQRSSADSKVSIRAWGRLPNGSEVQGVLIEDSTSAQVLSDPGRLGDYTDIEVDFDGESFWIAGEYIKTGTGEAPQAVWTTRFSEIEVDSN